MGQLGMTPGVKEALDDAQQSPAEFLSLHESGNWGDVPAEDAEANQKALEEGLRILSSYKTNKGATIWIITEADRSQTTLLLPEEY
jgi:hypothetical protein